MTRPGLRPGWVTRVSSLSLALALALVIGARPEPLSTGPRPPVAAWVAPSADRTAAPAPYVGDDFATLPFVGPQDLPGTWVVSRAALPLRMVVEQEVADRYGLEAVSEALAVWNGTPGSVFEVEVAGTTTRGVQRKAADGISRVFMDRRDCGGRFLARAHLHRGVVEVRDTRTVSWVNEVDIGICDRLTDDLLAPVLRHEVAHVAGLGHLCDVGTECWLPEMGHDNRCRLMNPASYPCQHRDEQDDAGLVYLHPRLPRVAGGDRVATMAAVSFLTFPDQRAENRVLLSPVDAPAPLQAAATVLAALEGVPHLLVEEACTEGPAGEELNRVTSIGATAVLVGAVSMGCRDQLQIGWEFQTEELHDVRAVTDAIVAALGEPRRLVLTAQPPELADQSGVADVALAAPAAARLGAPLLTTAPDQLDRLVSDVLADVPSITGVIVIGDERSISSEVTDELARRGLRVRRLDAADRVDVGLKIARMRDVFGTGPREVVLVGADRAGDAIAAATLAAARGGPVIPVVTGPASPDVRVGGYLSEQVRDGYVVGGHDAIGVPLFVRLNRAVDGVR